MPRHTVPMLEVYRYALSGATMERGTAVSMMGTTAEIVRSEPTRASTTRTKKSKTTIMFTYCPFCGKKARGGE